MKKLLTIIGMLGIAFGANASTIVTALTNFNNTLTTNSIRITLVTGPQVDGSYIVTGMPILTPTTNGAATNVLLGGTYKLEIVGITYPSPYYFAVPKDDNNTFNVTTLLISGGNIFNYTGPAAKITAGPGLAAITNGLYVTLETNGDALPTSVAAGNYVLASTNGSTTTISVTNVFNGTNQWTGQNNYSQQINMPSLNVTNGISAASATIGTAIITSETANSIATTSLTVGGTNIGSAAFQTSSPFTNSVWNTNTLIASGFGTSAVNGTYTWSSGANAYTKANNLIWHDLGNAFFSISNNVTGDEAYVLADNVADFGTGGAYVSGLCGWQEVGGAAPGGTILYATNANTNALISFVDSYSAPVLYVDPVNGKDSNNGATELTAMLTLSNAMRFATAGNVIRAMPGIHTIPQAFVQKLGVGILGYGSGKTVLTNSAFQSSISLQGDNILGGVSVYAFITGAGTGTNLIYDVRQRKEEDGLFPSSDGVWNIYDSKFFSQFDTFNEANGRHGTYNFYNCSMSVNLTTNSSNPVRGLAIGTSTINFYGGSIVVSNATSTNITGCIVFHGAGGQVNMVGTKLLYQATSATPYAAVLDTAGGGSSASVLFLFDPLIKTAVLSGALTMNQNYNVPASNTITAGTASTAAVFDAQKRLTNSATTATEIGYVSGVTSAIQTQLNAKGSGTVTSVSGPSIITWATSTTTPTGTLNTQTSNTFLSGPTSGSAATPTFRAMVAADFGSTLSPTFNTPIVSQLTGTQVVNSSPSTAVLINAATTTDYAITGMNANCTVTISNLVDTQTLTVDILGDASHTITWAIAGTTGTLKWPGGIAPVQTLSQHDVYTFHQVNSLCHGIVDANSK